MSETFDVVVVGGGIAGLCAAMTSARQGHRVAVMSGDLIGGQLVSINKIDGIPGFPDGVAGYDLCPMAQEQASAAGVEFVTARCTSISRSGEGWRLASDEAELAARAVVIATGAEAAKLNIPGEERLAGMGVSECASCDGPLYRNKVVAVIGSGDSGMQEALALAEHVGKVVMIESGPDLSGQKSYRDAVTANEKITFQFKCEPVEILGEAAVTGLKLRDSGSGETRNLDCAAVFPCVGLVPSSGLVRDLVRLDDDGRIPVDSGMRSATPGLCAVGNVRGASAHRAAGAMGDGATAAIAVDQYLATGAWPVAIA